MTAPPIVPGGPDCAAGRHLRGRLGCKRCELALCLHHTFSLRGCQLPEGHLGPHTNPWASDGRTWTDQEGAYVRTRGDWVGLVHMLGRRPSEVN